jgi:hypothetical protein
MHYRKSSLTPPSLSPPVRELLKLFSELYPAWAQNLNKNLEHKYRICGGYAKILVDLESKDVQKITDWLASENNKEYRTWPPPPLELLSIVKILKEKKIKEKSKTLAKEAITSLNPLSDPNSVDKWVCRPITDLPAELQDLKPMIIRCKEIMVGDKSFWSKVCWVYLSFYTLLDRMRLQKPEITLPEIREQFFSQRNIGELVKQLGSLQLYEEVLKFLREVQYAPLWFN